MLVGSENKIPSPRFFGGRPTLFSICRPPNSKPTSSAPLPTTCSYRDASRGSIRSGKGAIGAMPFPRGGGISAKSSPPASSVVSNGLLFLVPPPEGEARARPLSPGVRQGREFGSRLRRVKKWGKERGAERGACQSLTRFSSPSRGGGEEEKNGGGV